MILIDFSALAYQSMHSAIAATKPSLRDNKYVTEEFTPFMLYRIIESIIEVQDRFSNYGDVVLCLDGESKRNWRKALFPMYKANRAKERKESQIKFDEVFPVFNELIGQLALNSPYKVVRVPEAEGDDVIMVLARDLPGPHMIVSSDKDLIQMQCYPGIKQYSPMTQKFVTPATKHGDTMQEWLVEHVVLGDSTDNVIRVVDGLEFTEEYRNSLTEPKTEAEVRNGDWGELALTDIFVKPRFGMATALKAIKEHGGLDSWLDSDPRLRSNYELNSKLVLEAGIPDTVRKDVVGEYSKASAKTQLNEFKKFLALYNISHLELILNWKAEFSVEDLF